MAGELGRTDVATVCVSRARWDAMQAVLAAARYWRQTGYNSEYAGEDELAEAIDRLAAVERRENEPPHLLY